MSPGMPSIATWFQSTPPARRATFELRFLVFHSDRFNPRPPRGGRLERNQALRGTHDVSIHAPRAEGDPDASGPVPSVEFQSTPPARRARRVPTAVSIHAPRAEGDSGSPQFQSTPPARRATDRCAGRQSLEGFNPRPPRGGRLENEVAELSRDGVSIHAPRAEGVGQEDTASTVSEFQSTPPARRATSGSTLAGFNPRPPRGGRLSRDRSVAACTRVSIHAPRAEGDART